MIRTTFKLLLFVLLATATTEMSSVTTLDTVAARTNCCGGGCEVLERPDCDFYSCEGFSVECNCRCYCGITVVIQGPDGIPEEVVLPVYNSGQLSCN